MGLKKTVDLDQDLSSQLMNELNKLLLPISFLDPELAAVHLDVQKISHTCCWVLTTAAVSKCKWHFPVLFVHLFPFSLKGFFEKKTFFQAILKGILVLLSLCMDQGSNIMQAQLWFFLFSKQLARSPRYPICTPLFREPMHLALSNENSQWEMESLSLISSFYQFFSLLADEEKTHTSHFNVTSRC